MKNSNTRPAILTLLVYMSLCGFKASDVINSATPEVQATVIENKVLDLSLPPLKSEPENNNQQVSALTIRRPESIFFDTSSVKKERSVQLDGKLLMSQEQEVEKRKSLDGAGIVIRVNP